MKNECHQLGESLNPYQPQKIKFLQNGKWVTINITNIRVGKQPDKLFHFNAKETDKAEIIDLR